MLELFQQPIFQYILYYIVGGVCFNLGYDLIVDKLNDDNMRFTMLERLSVGIIWPIFTVIFIINFLKAIFNGNE